MNDTTRRYPRTSREAFGLDASEACAVHIYRMSLHRRVLLWLMNWGWAPCLIVVMLLTGCSADMRHEHIQAQQLIAQQQEDAARASREFAGQAVCGPGALAEWQDDKPLVCIPKRGRAYQVAEVTK